MAAGTQTAYDIDVADGISPTWRQPLLLARLFKPRGSGPFPIMVELHGGAWVRGDRLNGNAANEALARTWRDRGALDFARCLRWRRIQPLLADIHYGIRWCKTQAPAWNGRPDRIGAMGNVQWRAPGHAARHAPARSALRRAVPSGGAPRRRMAAWAA